VAEFGIAETNILRGRLNELCNCFCGMARSTAEKITIDA
jgi:hypothetical protein